MKEAFPARGNLKHYSLPRLLRDISRERKTGIITFSRNNVKKSIYLKDGIALFASSSLAEDRIGSLLTKRGKITSQQLEKSLKILRKSRRLGTLLVDLGYLNPRELFWAIRNQVKRIILTLFHWEEGTFSYREIEPPEEAITLNMSMDTLIREGEEIKEAKKREDERLFLEKAERILSNIGSISYYDILGVDLKATSSEIKEAYHAMAQNWHPDRYRDIPDTAAADKLSEFFTLLNKAYKTLRTAAERSKYNHILMRRITILDPENALLQVSDQYNRGMAEFKEGNFLQAADFFRWTTWREPDNANYWAHLSLALSRVPRRNKEAE